MKGNMSYAFDAIARYRSGEAGSLPHAIADAIRDAEERGRKVEREACLAAAREACYLPEESYSDEGWSQDAVDVVADIRDQVTSAIEARD